MLPARRAALCPLPSPVQCRIYVPATDDPELPPNSSDEERGRVRSERLKQAKASAIGLQFGISIAIGALLGNWLDHRFDTEPALLFLGVAFGAAAGFRDLYRLAKDGMKDEGS